MGFRESSLEQVMPKRVGGLWEEEVSKPRKGQSMSFIPSAVGTRTWEGRGGMRLGLVGPEPESRRTTGGYAGNRDSELGRRARWMGWSPPWAWHRI